MSAIKGLLRLDIVIGFKKPPLTEATYCLRSSPTRVFMLSSSTEYLAYLTQLFSDSSNFKFLTRILFAIKTGDAEPSL